MGSKWRGSAGAATAGLAAAGWPATAGEAGLAPLFEPFFNEFVVAAPGGQRWFDETVASGLVPGVRLAGVGSELEGRLLVTVTETTRDSAVDRLVAALAGGPDA